MFRFTIPHLLQLTMLVIVGGLPAQQPGRTLKELLKLAAADESVSEAFVNMMRYHMSYHAAAKFQRRQHLLVISWFDQDERTVLRYTVTEGGDSHNVRFVCNGPSQASQASHFEQLSAESMRILGDVLTKLRDSKAEPPIERTVHVSFQSGDKWRTETYDAADLPAEFEKVMLIIGKRFETNDRQKKNAQ